MFFSKIDVRVSSRQADSVSTGKSERKNLFGKRRVDINLGMT